MLEFSLAIVAGLVVLVWSADRFVMGASALAYNLGVAPLIIGMVIMGFGTSAPEMFVAGVAAMGNNPEVAVGNALGSNIANIALVLGLSALIQPLSVQSKILRREFPALFIITITVVLLFLDGELSRSDGVVLLLGSAAMIGWLMHLAKSGRNQSDDVLVGEIEAEVPHDLSTAKAVMWALLALVLLVSSSHLLVWGAVGVAKAFGLSDLVIGLTIIAVGTSLPEVAVSVTGAMKGEDDLALGNIIGSNMFNLLSVLGVGASIQAAQLSAPVLERDYPVMVALTILLYLMARGHKGGAGRINRYEGTALLLCYVSYLVWLYITEIQVA